MKISINTAPAVEPISLTDAKLHLRLATSAAGAAAYTDEDDWLTREIKTARKKAEDRTNRALINQTWEAYLDDWPGGEVIDLPFSPLQSVTSVKYRLEDDSGYDNTFSDYATDTKDEPGRIVLLDGYSWPSETLYEVNPIQIIFVCGYGAAAANVPSGIKSAILLMITNAYEHRGTIESGTTISRIDDALDGLLWDYFAGRVL